MKTTGAAFVCSSLYHRKLAFTSVVFQELDSMHKANHWEECPAKTPYIAKSCTPAKAKTEGDQVLHRNSVFCYLYVYMYLKYIVLGLLR